MRLSFPELDDINANLEQKFLTSFLTSKKLFKISVNDLGHYDYQNHYIQYLALVLRGEKKPKAP